MEGLLTQAFWPLPGVAVPRREQTIWLESSIIVKVVQEKLTIKDKIKDNAELLKI